MEPSTTTVRGARSYICSSRIASCQLAALTVLHTATLPTTAATYLPAGHTARISAKVLDQSVSILQPLSVMAWSRMLSCVCSQCLLTPFSVSTEKEAPYAPHAAIGSPTPDYSAPQVVPGQHGYPFGAQPFSPSSHGGSTLASPQPRPYTFKEHVDTYEHQISRPGSVPPPVPPKDDRKCGLKKRTFWMLIGCVIFWLIALAAGLGAGLGIGLSKKSK